MSPRASPRDVADRLHSAAIHLLRRVRRTDPQTGVSAAQLSALSVLMGGPRTLGELAAAEQVRPPTMTKLVQELERAGLAARERDAADARVVRVRSTAKGQRVLQRGREMRITELERRLRGLDATELATLERAVGIIERVVRD
ncbi:MAG TPA: MarR family transcriptional regulator [Candidatus Limnocylindria bacterium]|nr:MarR family transcriptional regulator [Candidatus Limnocylindria bacterium]